MSTAEGMVFNIERFAVHDGPGIRTTVFLKGCPLHCLWCHNPEGIGPGPELFFRQTRCIGCGDCVDACLRTAITKRDGRITVDRAKCIRCFRCAAVCPSRALERVGAILSVDDVLQETLADLPFYRISGGGVTFSGGEPLYQSDFLKELLIGHRERGIHTAVETSLGVPWMDIANITEYVDLLLVDLKVMDAGELRMHTGAKAERVLENIRRIFRTGIPVILRVPLIPGYTAQRENIEAMIDLLAEHRGSIEYVSLLPYHRLGEAKSESLGNDGGFQIDAMPPEEVAEIRAHFQQQGFQARIGY
jgi:pyruvate formate lyase activating enzyme